jgi:enterochelin esterase-like enzyme
MTSLSHEQAREFIQQNHLAEEDRLALRQHLAACDECRTYAAMHVLLMRDLPLRAARAMPTAAQRAAIRAAAEGHHPVPPFWRPLSAVGGLAAILFLSLAFWFVLRAASPVADRPLLPAPWATFIAPFRPQTTPTPATAEPTATPTPEASPAATPDPRGRYAIDTVPAPSLAGNVVGEPLEQQVAVYLPPSYDSTNRRYPVVYALINDYVQYANQPGTLDNIIRSGMNLALRDGAPEMIVVAPNYANALNLFNYYVDSPISGDWESYIAGDLVDYIDAHYRTLPAADSRGLLGETYTGLSALTIAMRHPDTFGAVYLQRPLVFEPGALEGHEMVSPIGRTGVLDLYNELSALSSDEALAYIKEWFAPGKPYLNTQFMAVIYGMAFAPATEPPYFEYPYADTDGPPDPEIWRKWESGLGDIPAKIEPYHDTLLTLNIAMSSVDEPGTGSTYLSEQLMAAGIPHAFSRPDTTAIEELGNAVFPFFSEALDFE